MKKLTLSRILNLFILGLLALCWSSLALAARTPMPSPPPVSGQAHVLMEYHSGDILAQSDADEPREPASLTKLMTAYVAFSALEDGAVSLDDQITVSERAWRMAGSRMFIEVNTRVSLRELLKGMIIQSGNDASVAIAEHVGGSEESFVQMMNATAASLGMHNSHFANSTGMPDPMQLVTARDIAILARALIRDFPDNYGWYSQREYSYNGIRQHNRNRLLWRDDSVDGLKTGYTSSAGYSLVSSAKRNDMRLISVVLGARGDQSRVSDSQSLLNYGFRFFESHQLYAAGEELTRTRVWRGARDSVGLGVREDLRVTVPRGRYESLDAYMDLESAVAAPVGMDQQVGVVRVTLDDEVISERPLYPLEAVDEGGLIRRLFDDIRLWFM